MVMLLTGFAPLIVLFGLFAGAISLYAELLGIAELALNGDRARPARRCRGTPRWACLTSWLTLPLVHTLSLREHSPPAILS